MTKLNFTKNIRPLQRFITTHNAQGQAVFSNNLSEDMPVQKVNEVTFSLAYTTDQFPAQLSADADLTSYEQNLSSPPGLSISTGTVCRIVDMPPGQTSPMHRTVSLDYGVVLEGEVELLLDSGETRLLKRGDVAVQRATNHAWRNVTPDQGWSRIDLLRRHARGHYPGRKDCTITTSSIKGRVSRACKRCASSKLKCDDTKPCRRCVKRGLDCQWSQEDIVPEPDPSCELSKGFVGMDNQTNCAITSEPVHNDLPTPALDTPLVGEDFYSTAEDPMSQVLMEQSRLPLMMPDDYGLLGANTTSELGLTEADLEFLATFNDYAVGRERPNVATSLSSHSIPESLGLMDKEAYHNSPLSHWTPRTEDNAYMYQQYLSVPKHLDRSISSGAAEGRVLPENLSKEARDTAFTVVVQYENDNSHTRHLRQQQAYALTLQVGLWSGDKRRVEIAESFVQPIITMLRRASHFREERYPPVTPTIMDDEETLQQKWRQWVELESYKRATYHMFTHDIQSSFRLSTHALTSYGELELPFPCARQLWNAKSATEWACTYLQDFSDTPSYFPSLASALKDPSPLHQLPHHIDFPLAAFITIHGMAAMVVDCNRTRYGLSRPWSNLLFQSWQRELEQELDHFGITIAEPLCMSVPSVSLIYQAVSLSLYLPLGILETFAGKDGEKRSADVYRAHLQNTSPLQLRQAAWHAGQILRIAKSIPPGHLTGFGTTCLYFAALALWTYSAISAPGDSAHSEPKSDSGPPRRILLLDDENNNGAVRRFVVSGQGIPALSSENGPARLDDEAAVMRLFQQVLRSKYHNHTVPQQTQAVSHAFSALGSIVRLKEGGRG
ncbi:hypothetical protein BDV25DRAFT_172098 [Aspergillus avenaceus]|uniref:Zn(2)-C6 fungal-type domain-containing protein n=1 Tax=Aspergillus avenaceus TaxID=36643 RepID=A0A5N6U7R2_ASPAV|nr:hypothetical protein BDV25DRAFT_172098 [Aspergillus avenaceus]